MFCHFWQKFENSKWPPFLKIFLNCQEYIAFIPWVENFNEIALSHTVKEIEPNLCFSIFIENSKWPPFFGRGDRSKFVFWHFWQKFENSKWPPFLGSVKFLKIAKSTLFRYSVGRKFRRNLYLPPQPALRST